MFVPMIVAIVDMDHDQNGSHLVVIVFVITKCNKKEIMIATIMDTKKDILSKNIHE